jgi:hypothetical protein
MIAFVLAQVNPACTLRYQAVSPKRLLFSQFTSLIKALGLVSAPGKKPLGFCFMQRIAIRRVNRASSPSLFEGQRSYLSGSATK